MLKTLGWEEEMIIEKNGGSQQTPRCDDVDKDAKKGGREWTQCQS
jgi:hypothetical protein